jgi:hypothetical protein
MLNSKSIGLLNDFTKALGQQLYFWGCDIEHPRGNLLCEFGMDRLESESIKSTSRYRMDFNGDLIELHGLCVGRYSKKLPSFLYTRQFRRCWVYGDSKPPLPGQYNKELITTNSFTSLEGASLQFLEWWLEYELWISRNTDPSYRKECFNTFKKLPKSNAWLHPDIALSWLQQYRDSRSNLKRSREWKREYSVPLVS